MKMKSTIVDAKVVAVDKGAAKATLIDQDEIDDVVTYEIFIPAYFGGHSNPWPKVGEVLRFHYDHSIFARNPIQNVWRPSKLVIAT